MTTTKRKTKKQLKAEAREEVLVGLRRILKPGDTILCVLRHVSQSGMSRRIDFYTEDGVRPLTDHVADVLDYKHSDKGGVVVSGCGMDMGFHVVYSLSHALFPKGFKVKGRGRNGDTSGWDKDGGYALRHRWL